MEHDSFLKVKGGIKGKMKYMMTGELRQIMVVFAEVRDIEQKLL
jgi:hypothetical protein